MPREHRRGGVLRIPDCIGSDDGVDKLVRVARLHADDPRHPLRPVRAQLREEVRVVVSRCLERAGVSSEVELEKQSLDLVPRRCSGE